MTNEEGAHSAVAHLLAVGWKRIALVAGPRHLNVAQERERGHQRALREAGTAVDPELVRGADFREGRV